MKNLSLQERFAPSGVCFGCGQTNVHGLRIRSVVEGDELIARWTPSAHHAAFAGVLNGGICGALLDCHSNWTAMYSLMMDRGLDRPVLTVTGSFHVKLRRPTPLDGELVVRARAVRIDGHRVTVESSIEAAGKVTATCSGLFVAVPDDHPAAVGFHAER
jgi:acyl-coenzyme A thioesterase PaaI-like protein